MWIVNRLQTKGGYLMGWHAVLKGEGVDAFILAGPEGSRAALNEWQQTDEFHSYGVSEVYEFAQYILSKEEFNYIMNQAEVVF